MKYEPEIVKTMRELESKGKLNLKNLNKTPNLSNKKEKISYLAKISLNNSLSKEIIFKTFKGIVNEETLEGFHTEKFEDDIKIFFDTNHAISTSSGRMAFYLILKALELEKGDEIIIPAYMLPILPQISEFFGLKPVFADIDINTLNMDLNDVEKKITKKTKVILAVHLFGLPCDMERISELATKNDIIVIEDCAQAFGATYKGRKVGTFGDAAYLSFNTCKNLNTFGGGMILTNNEILNSKIRNETNSFQYPPKFFIRKKLLALSVLWFFFTPFIFSYLTYPFLRVLYFLKKDYVRNFWKSDQVNNLDYVSEENFLTLYSFKYTNLQAYIGLNQLKKLEKVNLMTNKNANFLSDHLKDLRPESNDGRLYFRYCIRTKNSEESWYKLFKSGIYTVTGSYLVLPDLEMFKDYFSDCPNSRKISKELIYIPIRPYLKKRHMMNILKILDKIGLNKFQKNLILDYGDKKFTKTSEPINVI